jgi:hypothetical protein
MELASSGLAALSAMDCPLGSTRARPPISTRTGCGVAARFTIFKSVVPARLSRVTLENSVGTCCGGGGGGGVVAGGCPLAPPRRAGGCHARVGIGAARCPVEVILVAGEARGDGVAFRIIAAGELIFFRKRSGCGRSNCR